MSSSEGVYELLFELSNEHRHWMLLLLQKKAMRITDIVREMNLNNPEIRRHISRLRYIGLIQRDVEGYYHLTPYGETSLLLFQEFEFLSFNSEYFKTHSPSNIPIRFLKRIGELGKTIKIENTIDFFRYTEKLFRESKEHLWFLVDQFPMNSLLTIVETLNRGVKLRIIEPRERILNPDLDAMSSEETQALNRTRSTPLVEQRMLDEVYVILFLSEDRAVLAFPTSDGKYDYTGFATTQGSALDWCRELFQYYWWEAKQRTTAPIIQVKRGHIPRGLEPSNKIIVVGQERPEIDAQAVQDAVDNYDEVILRGTFNFGTVSVLITKSVVIRGEGRETDVPTTTIYKKGWSFPFTEWDCIFKIDGEGADVTLENIQFTDFNHTCIWGVQCNNLNIKNNRITLMTGYGRGMRYAAFGDVVIGICVRPEHGVFKGGVSIKGNHIDFARGGAFGGFLTRGGLEEDPEYRPDLFNHEYYMGFGIALLQTFGNVSIENNIIRNINARGIAVTGNLPSANVKIRHNTIISDLYGSYPFSSPEAGAGILAQSAWGFPSPGFNVEIEENTIKLDRLNYCGIIALGPVMDREGAGKLKGGTIRKNRIQLKEGYEGIHVRKCDDFEVIDNTISGKVYYGIRVSGRKKPGELDLSALNNLVKDNDMRDLVVKRPDEYSDSHSDGRMFAVTPRGSATSHVWLDSNSKGNVVKLSKGETFIDEGEDNRISFS